MAERGTRRVDASDKGSEREGGKHPCARGEARNGGSRKREEEREEDDEREEKEERATEGKSRATCTRQQPPTSEELIINLLSPSPNAAVPLLDHLRFTFTCASHSRQPPLRSALFTLTRPFYLSLSSRFLPPSALLSASLLSCLLPSTFSSPLLHPRRGVFTITITRTLAFAAFPSRSRLRFPPPSYRPPNLVATFGLPNARGMRRPASRRLKSRISFWPTIMMHDRGKKSLAVIYGAITSSKDIALALNVT